MNPSFAAPANSMMAPTRIASIEARAIACAGSPLAPTIGRIVAAIIGPSDESGPSTRICDGPTIAYAIRHRIVV